MQESTPHSHPAPGSSWGLHRMILPGCSLPVSWQRDLFLVDHQATWSPEPPASFCSLGPPTAVHSYAGLVTLKYGSLGRTAISPTKMQASYKLFYIFFKNKQFKIGLPFHIFIQSRLMCPCLYYIFHPCHLWLSQHYEDVLQISVNGNIQTLAIYQRGSRRADLCYTHPQGNASGIFHISLDRAIFLWHQK